MRLIVEDMPKFQPGGSGEVTLNIVNRGLLGVKYLVVTLQDTEDYKILTPAEIYIGSLSSDDFDTIKYQIHELRPDFVEIAFYFSVGNSDSESTSDKEIAICKIMPDYFKFELARSGSFKHDFGSRLLLRRLLRESRCSSNHGFLWRRQVL